MTKTNNPIYVLSFFSQECFYFSTKPNTQRGKDPQMSHKGGIILELPGVIILLCPMSCLDSSISAIHAMSIVYSVELCIISLLHLCKHILMNWHPTVFIPRTPICSQYRSLLPIALFSQHRMCNACRRRKISFYCSVGRNEQLTVLKEGFFCVY